ncbi:restriction endonuclease subunit S [Rahnella rivi]|uniref:restriction endonuclease subunit S n=1 Tax=Rahnella rivi TaxID=2816249 RepID=UPI0039BDAB71
MTDKKTVKFGDICREVKLTTKDPIADGYERYIGLEHLDSGSLKIKRWGIIVEDNPSFTRVFKKGHILFGKRRPYLKKAAIAEFDGVCSGDIIVMETKSDNYNEGFLPFIVQSAGFWDHAVNTSSGSLSPRTRFKSLADYLIPGSFIAQKSNVLSLLQKGHNVELLNSSLINSSLRLYFSVLTNIFKQGLNDPSWTRCLLWECSTIQTGLALSSKREFEGETIRVPYLRVANVYDGHFELDEIKEVEVTPSMYERYRVQKGDILIAEGGDYDKVGRGHVWNDEVKGIIHQNHLFAIRTDREKLLPEFFNYMKSSFIGIKFFLGIAQQTTNLATINSTQVKKFPCVFPSIERQKELVEQLDMLSNFATSLSQRKESVRNVYKSIING